MFCDCTGDSRLGLEAGADMRSGREARAGVRRIAGAGETGESHARFQHPVHVAAVSQSDAVHAAGVGAQNHQGTTEAPADHELGVRLLVDRVGRRSRGDRRQRAHPLRTAVHRDGRVGLHQEQRRVSGQPALGDGLGGDDARQARQPPIAGRLSAEAAGPDARQFSGLGGDRRMGDGRPSAGGLRPARSAAQYDADVRRKFTKFRCGRFTAATSPTC